MPFVPSFATKNRPSCSRRSIIAAAAGLALSAARSNSAAAQISTEDLPDAAGAISQNMPVPAPALNFTNASGKALSLANFKGSGLVVSIWATWCGPCVAELPTLAAISQALAKAKILVLPISVDMDGGKSVPPFYAQHHINLPVLLDPDGNTLNALQSNGIPTTIIVNPQGEIAGRCEGGADWNTPATLALLLELAGPKTDASDVQPV